MEKEYSGHPPAVLLPACCAHMSHLAVGHLALLLPFRGVRKQGGWLPKEAAVGRQEGAPV